MTDCQIADSHLDEVDGVDVWIVYSEVQYDTKCGLIGVLCFVAANLICIDINLSVVEWMR